MESNNISTINHVRLFRLTAFVYTLVAIITIVVVSTIFAPASRWPFNPVTYHKVDMVKSVAVAGDSFSYMVYFTKRVNKTGIIARYLECQHQATVALGLLTLADANINDTMKYIRVEIPRSTMSDTCRVKWTVEYEYFGIRKVPVRCVTPWFTVVNYSKNY